MRGALPIAGEAIAEAVLEEACLRLDPVSRLAAVASGRRAVEQIENRDA